MLLPRMQMCGGWRLFQLLSWKTQVMYTFAPEASRYTRQAATLYADGHTAVNSPVALLDMRVWIDAASTVGFTHDAGSGDWSGP